MSTRRQTELLAFIKSYIAAHDGTGPSYEEMTAALGLGSKSGIHRLVDALERQGLIVRSPHLARSIRVVEPEQLKATTLLTEIVEHWTLYGDNGLGAIIDRARRVVA